MIKFNSKKGTSIATPFKSLFNNWRQIIIKIPVAIKKFPQTKVLGNKINTEANRVMDPLTITAVLPKFHFPNISNISGFAVSIFHPCFAPINTAKRIKIEFKIFNIIVFRVKIKKANNSVICLSKLINNFEIILSCNHHWQKWSAR